MSSSVAIKHASWKSTCVTTDQTAETWVMRLTVVSDFSLSSSLLVIQLGVLLVCCVMESLIETSLNFAKFNQNLFTDLPDITVPVYATPATTTTTPAVVLGSRPPFSPCRADQSKCQSGECINQNSVCDRVKDCLDGSDELGCGKYVGFDTGNDLFLTGRYCQKQKDNVH